MKDVIIKLRDKADKLLTWPSDKQKHANGAYISNWIIMLVWFFMGRNAALIASGILMVVAILWEFSTSKFSVLDIVFFGVGIVPLTALIYNTNDTILWNH